MTVLHMPGHGPVPQSIPQHIAICVPCVDSKVHFRFAQSLSMIHYFCALRKVHVASMFQNGSIISKQRNLCVKYAREEIETKQSTPISHILFLDSDMVFPYNVVVELLFHKKDIVGASYVRRSPPFDVLGKTLHSKPINTNDEGTPRLIEMAALPTGCLLIKREVFDRLTKPYFTLPWKEESSPGKNDEIEWGEDFAFCTKARASGFQVWLDVELTKRIGHVSEKVLYPEEDSFPDLKETSNA